MRVPLPATRIFLVAILAATSTATAQTTDDLFEPGTLNDLRLFMNSRDLQQLRDTFEENTYYQADLEWHGIRVRSVAIRSRGHGSRNPAKPALRIDFNRYVAGQRFLGLESLEFRNRNCLEKRETQPGPRSEQGLSLQPYWLLSAQTLLPAPSSWPVPLSRL